MQMLTKGTNKHSEGQLVDELETYAISLNGSGEMDTSMVTAGCLTHYIGRAIELMGEVVLEPNFPAYEFEKLRRQSLASLAITTAEPEYIAEREFRHVLYGQHPYSRTATGEIDDVNLLKVDDLKKWWGMYARPDMAVLIFAGDIDKSQAVKLAKEKFGNWKVRGQKPVTKLPQAH